MALEAWASRRPVIASRVGGLIDLISDGRDGLLVTPGDTAAFARAVSSVLANDTIARALGLEGHKTALRSFTWDSVTARLLRLYEEVVREARAKTPRVVASVSPESERSVSEHQLRQ